MGLPCRKLHDFWSELRTFVRAAVPMWEPAAVQSASCRNANFEIASAYHVTSSLRLKLITPTVTAAPKSDISQLTPWFAAGTLDPREARLFAAATQRDPGLVEDLAAARAERAEVAAMGEALGRPSMRPMMALFAAIDAELRSAASDGTRLAVGQTHAPLPPPATASNRRLKKIRHWR
jgi:hypothetical protein